MCIQIIIHSDFFLLFFSFFFCLCFRLGTYTGRERGGGEVGGGADRQTCRQKDRKRADNKRERLSHKETCEQGETEADIIYIKQGCGRGWVGTATVPVMRRTDTVTETATDTVADGQLTWL